MPTSLRRDVRLNSAIEFYCKHALAPATQASYSTGVNCYFNFLALHGTIQAPTRKPSEELLIYFVAHCAQNLNLAYPTIKSYLAGIRNFYIAKGFRHPFLTSDGSPFLKLQLVITGIRKQQAKPSKPRLPITGHILKTIVNNKQILFGTYLDLLIKTACTMAYFGFLRCGEFTCLTKRFDPGSNLCMSDITIYYHANVSVRARVVLKSSKTDPFRQGCEINLFPTNSILCPVRYIHLFCSVRQAMNAQANDPFFLMPNGQPLTRYAFLSMLKLLLHRLGFNATDYSGHSFRIGAATSAAAANVPDHLIKTLGRWSSDCYQRYIRTSPVVLEEALCAMASTCTTHN